MVKFFTRIYDYFRSHRWLNVLLLMTCLLVFIWRALSLNFKEDISDFLPVDQDYKRAMGVYQQINAGDKIFIFLSPKNNNGENLDELITLTDEFADSLRAADTRHLLKSVQEEIDYDKYLEGIDFIYNNIPYFFNDADFKSMRELDVDAINGRLDESKEMLLLPTSGLLSQNISRDPLNLLTPVVERYTGMPQAIDFDVYDGHIFTKSDDLTRSIIIIETPFGASESKGNTEIINLLDTTINKFSDRLEGTYIGNATIAVSNANRIKQDSVWTIILAVVLIAGILGYFFRNLRNIMLIVFALAFGWLFALAVIATTGEYVSVIVIGIASVIIGIAVNYPLHYLAHLKHQPDRRATLRELVAPLLIGNVTTVGAFCALIPLDSTALRDLGIFSAMMLIGTIAFVLFFLPHMAKVPKNAEKDHHVSAKSRTLPYFAKKCIVWFIVVATTAFAWFSRYCSFDTNMANINYMTSAQKELFASLRPHDNGTTQLYILSDGKDWDEAIRGSESAEKVVTALKEKGLVVSHTGLSLLIPSAEAQHRKIQSWQKVIEENKDISGASMRNVAEEKGFAPDAFEDFYEIINKEYHPRDFDYFHSALSQNVDALSVNDGDIYTAVDVISVTHENLDRVKSTLKAELPEQYVFDITSLNGRIAQSLSDNFNYIGWACGIIVFIFLWLTFGRLEIACIAFLPMAVSWIWILGIMYLVGIQFNLVNIILATFIFGQGDDYSIFMTDGLIHEYTFRKKILQSYRTSIMLSAAIMFVGIGVLIFAKHPALHSLGQVTLVGMGTVIIMTYLLPPLAYGWLIKTMKNGRFRPFPITLKVAAMNAATKSMLWCLGIISGMLPAKTLRRCLRWVMRHTPGIKFNGIAEFCNSVSEADTIICHHASDPALCALVLAALDIDVHVVYDTTYTRHPLIARLASLLPHSDISDNPAELKSKLLNTAKLLIITAHNISDETIEAIAKVSESGNVASVYIHGLEDILPDDSLLYRGGTCTIDIAGISADAPAAWCEICKRQYEITRNRCETPEYFAPYIRNRYAYKNFETERDARKELRNTELLESCSLRTEGSVEISITEEGVGVKSLMMALMNRNCTVTAKIKDSERYDIVASLTPMPKNLNFVKVES